MKIRIANVIEESFVDGEGIRFTIFVQGCPHHCKGCHNPGTHDFNGGRIVDTDELILKFSRAKLINGITLTGGEPVCQISAVTELAKAAKENNLNVWCYTGYTYEELLNATENKNFLNYVDVLVDGPFIESQRDLTMPFCGSKNQRLIDIPKTLKQKKIVTWLLCLS